MANEVTVTATLSVTKSSITSARTASAATFDLAGEKYIDAVQLIDAATTEEALKMGDLVLSVAAPGYCWMKNLDGTNTISIRAATGESELISLAPGQVAIFPMGASAPFIISSLGTPKLQYLIYEN